MSLITHCGTWDKPLPLQKSSRPKQRKREIRTLNQSFDAVVLGGGAAGLMCAVEAGKRGRRVVLLEHSNSIGKKILISGGGRCNFTNIHCQPENFISANPHFAKSALARYTPSDFVALVREHHISYHEKTLGQLFCDRSARDIVQMLETECRAAGVRMLTGVAINQVRHNSTFKVQTATDQFSAPALVVATGGLSVPKTGATSFGYDLARQFDLKIRGPWPALVPLVLGAEDRAQYCDLAGVSTEVTASSGKQSFREKMLITHRGLSGPAILQISSYCTNGEPMCIDLAPDQSVTACFRDPSTPRTLSTLRSSLQSILPHRFAVRWLEKHAPSFWTNTALEQFEDAIHHWTIYAAGNEGFSKAEVTAGGIDTDELSAKTMECARVPGLYFIGEVVDVTGQLGGFNFQWAWASGAAAGRSV
jgi:predicted Rossmann fold flavoprotein